MSSVDLVVEGMTCASCAARIEKGLNRVGGVAATVNFATEVATVSYDADHVSIDDLVTAVSSAGYRAWWSSNDDVRLAHRPAALAAVTPVRPGPARAPSPAPTGGDVVEAAPPPARRPAAPAPPPPASRPAGLRLPVAGALSVPIALWAWLPATRVAGWQWASLVLATVVVAYGGWPLHRAAVLHARHLTATMDTLISLGTVAALAWSAVVLVTGAKQAEYFDSAALVTTLVLLGRYFEARATRRSGGALRALLQVGAKEAHVLRDGTEVLVPAEDVQVGDRFVVRPGEKVAADGVVELGTSDLDQSLLTGEPVPVPIGPGDEVVGGALNGAGRVVVRATRVGRDTYLAQVAALVKSAQAGKADAQRLADRVSGVFVPLVIGLALLTLAGWLVIGDASGLARALSAAVAVLVIACPCALGLATPTALMVGTGRGAQLGLLIRGPQVLEHARQVTTIVFDKTGTLTEGKMHVVAVVAIGGVAEDEVLALAATAEQASEHPIARALVTHARRHLAALALLETVEEFANRPGLGIEAVIAGHEVVVGRAALLSARGIQLPAALAPVSAAHEADGATVVAIARDGHALGLVALADLLKPTSRQAVAELKALGLTPVLVTGDNERTAAKVAAEVGITEFEANVLPEQKTTYIRRLQDAGAVVAMVGDGINDAPALAQADLGIALGTGADVAIEAADLTLVSGDPRAAVDAIRLARRTLATIKGNLWWAFAYNVAAVPLAVAGIVNPVVASAAMALSSTFVVSNSLRLRRFQPVREAP
jgi:Cu+-exporting ATPase